MTTRHTGAFKGRGQYTDRMVPIQAMIPSEIDEAVARKATETCFSKATYWRKWIIEGFKAAQKKGEI